jgi:hypothetical protein
MVDQDNVLWNKQREVYLAKLSEKQDINNVGPED